MQDTFFLIAIFIAGPAVIAYLGVRSYRNIVRREAQQAAAEKAARESALPNSQNSSGAEPPRKDG